LGSGLAWTFDLATGPDVEQLRSLLHQVLTTTNKALSAWTVGQNLITRVTKLSSNRFDRIDRLINLTRQSIVQENRRMQNLKIEGYTALRLLPVIIEQIGDIMIHFQEIESLYLALKDLSVGRLSRHLIETEILQDHLNLLGETIKKHNPRAQIVHPYVRYYYTSGNVASGFHKFRDENTLVIVINVPLTISDLAAPMQIWQVHTFPFLSPDGAAYYTELTQAPKYVIYSSENKYYAVANDCQNLPCTHYQRFGCLFKIPNSNLILHPTSDESCAMSLFGTDLIAIKRHCVYHVIFGTIEPTVYQISQDKLHMLNISSIYVYREGRFSSESETSWKSVTNISSEISINGTQSIYTLPCEARVKVLNNIHLSKAFCDDSRPRQGWKLVIHITSSSCGDFIQITPYWTR